MTCKDELYYKNFARYLQFFLTTMTNNNFLFISNKTFGREDFILKDETGYKKIELYNVTNIMSCETYIRCDVYNNLASNKHITFIINFDKVKYDIESNTQIKDLFNKICKYITYDKLFKIEQKLQDIEKDFE